MNRFENQSDGDASDPARRVRRNEQITAAEVSVISPEGQKLGVMPISEARGRAAACRLDLVEIAPNAVPPVCRIMDFDRYLREQRKKPSDDGSPPI